MIIAKPRRAGMRSLISFTGPRRDSVAADQLRAKGDRSIIERGKSPVTPSDRQLDVGARIGSIWRITFLPLLLLWSLFLSAPLPVRAISILPGRPGARARLTLIELIFGWSGIWFDIASAPIRIARFARFEQCARLRLHGRDSFRLGSHHKIVQSSASERAQPPDGVRPARSLRLPIESNRTERQRIRIGKFEMLSSAGQMCVCNE